MCSFDPGEIPIFNFIILNPFLASQFPLVTSYIMLISHDIPCRNCKFLCLWQVNSFAIPMWAMVNIQFFFRSRSSIFEECINSLLSFFKFGLQLKDPDLSRSGDSPPSPGSGSVRRRTTERVPRAMMRFIGRTIRPGKKKSGVLQGLKVMLCCLQMFIIFYNYSYTNYTGSKKWWFPIQGGYRFL